MNKLDTIGIKKGGIIMTKELEALERIQCKYVNVFKARENGKTQLVHDLNVIKKSLKALEIIKKYTHIMNDGFGEYLYAIKKLNQIPPEEYNLLKEVFL